ncbi:MAG TPA: hypothetical protein VEY67_12460 [Candidatus Dormibacteraeota bacterium]|nr:hypothetical protein [Candidatus Dormibacteraeota bacterium]
MSAQPTRRAERPLVAMLLVGVLAGWALEQLVPDPGPGRFAAPGALPLIAAAIAAAAIPQVGRSGVWCAQPALRWAAVVLLVWVANGLPFDLLTMAGLIGHRTASGAMVISTVYWPGLVTRAFSVAAAAVLARLALAAPVAAPSRGSRGWYGYAAFVFALPYPLLRTHWALGGTLGIGWPGAAGEGWEPLLIAIPWVLAAVLSLALAFAPAAIPRRVLLAGGWCGTVIVAMIGPAAVWSLVTDVAAGKDIGSGGIAGWVFALFYGSWFLWAIAAGAATRSYQSRTARPRAPAAV